MTKEDLEQISNVVDKAVNKAVDEAVDKAVEKAVDKAINKVVDTKFRVMVYDIVNDAVDNLRKEMLDRMFVFEQEYGDKIMAIYDAISIMQDKLNESQENQRKLNKRMDYIDTQTFSHEKRISNLENLVKSN